MRSELIAESRNVSLARVIKLAERNIAAALAVSCASFLPSTSPSSSSFFFSSLYVYRPLADALLRLLACGGFPSFFFGGGKTNEWLGWVSSFVHTVECADERR